MAVLGDDLGRAAHGPRHRHGGVRHRARQQPQQPLVARAYFVQQRREPPSAVESGEDHGQVVEAQERELVFDEGVDAQHRGDEDQNEDPLEVAEEEQLGALHRPRLGHGDLGVWIFSRAGAGPKVGNTVPARNSGPRLRGEWGVVPRGEHWSYRAHRRVPLPTPHDYAFMTSPRSRRRRAWGARGSARSADPPPRARTDRTSTRAGWSRGASSGT